MTLGRIARIALFASLAVLLSAFLASSGSHPAAKAPAHNDWDRRCMSVGGSIITNFGGVDANTTLGPATGDLRGAVAATLTAPPSPTRFAFTSYPARIIGGTGRFAGATGDLTNIGEADLQAGTAIRYSGQVCFAEQD